MTAPGLRSIAARRGRLYGAATTSAALEDPAFRAAFARECGLLTPEYEMKWDALEPEPGAWAPAGFDRLAAFAAAEGLRLHGHAAWWHEALPAFARALPPSDFAAAALGHLDRLLRYCRPHLFSLDVVNEPIALEHGRADALRRSPFLDAFGPGYLTLAFRRAAELAPGVLLVLNEMGLEYASSDAARKRRATVRLLATLRSVGAPIHCLGLQSHLDAGDGIASPDEFRAFLREVRNLGVRLTITELDVSDRDKSGTREQRDRRAADLCRRYLDVILGESEPVAVVTWGLSDALAWLTAADPGARPLPLDRRLGHKQLWHALAGMLGREPGRQA